MINAMPIRLLLCLLLSPLYSQAQPIQQKLHAHNDYKNARPFWEAWEAGCGSIETDLYWYRDSVYVAHDLTDVPKRMRLEQLYLEPIRQVLQQKGRIYKAPGAQLILLIDIKNKCDQTLQWLLATLRQYPDIFETDSGVVIALSGERPAPDTWEALPPYVFLDGRPYDRLTEAQWEKVALISTSFREVGRWNGKARLSSKEQQRFDELLAFAKAHNKALRYWATPDKPQAWRFLLKAGVDIIGTDEVPTAAEYISGCLQK